MKSKLLIITGLAFVLTFISSAQNAQAATSYSYSATNFSSTSCLLGSGYTVSNLTTRGDVVRVLGTGFGNRNLDDSIPEILYVPTNNGVLMVYRGLGSIDGVNGTPFGLLSWSDSEIQFEVAPGLGGTLGSYVILRQYSSANDNQGTCTRGALATYVAPPPTCTNFAYSEWSTCTDSQQTRTVLSSSPDGCAGGQPLLSQSCTPTCAANDYSCTDWSACVPMGTQTRTCTKSPNCEGGVSAPATLQNCSYAPPTCTSWLYSSWGVCSENGRQSRAVTSSLPDGCAGGDPVLVRSCTPTCSSFTYSAWSACTNNGIQTRTTTSSSPNGCAGGNPIIQQTCPSCTTSDYSCGEWNACASNSAQTRTCTKSVNCSSGGAAPAISQACVYTPPTCNAWTYSNWGPCSSAGQQERTIVSPSPGGCIGGSPILQQACTPPCASDAWSCSDWSECSGQGIQNRTCTRTFDCPAVATPAPATAQACTPPQPACNADVWTCGVWGECSLAGIQDRNCVKSFDCPSAETAAPPTSQYCESPNRPTQQAPPQNNAEVSGQDTIVRSTVKLLCPVDYRRASQGSGTVIDPSGVILTNKHVVAGTLGCLVGFINDFNDEPYFGERHIADIVRASPSQDVALLKLRNPNNRTLVSIDVAKGSKNPRLGSNISAYGFPAKFGTKLTYTSGDFSGTDGGYIKTTAILEYGNSGGGAYLHDGSFIGIPSAVVRGELNALGYLLSINAVNAWMNNAPLARGDTMSNKYSRVSVLEDIDLNKLDSLELFIPKTNKSGDLVGPPPVREPPPTANTDKAKPQIITPPEESIVIEPAPQPPKSSAAQDVPSEPKQSSQERPPWWRRFFHWIANLFK